MTPKRAVIIGAGPAGLTAALELLRRTDIRPIVLERSAYVGGLSKTVEYRGNRIDVGGHRFYSKSDRVLKWWFELMPLVDGADDHRCGGRISTEGIAFPGYGEDDTTFLVRRRKSRIFFLRKFFDYPLRLDPGLLRNLGLGRSLLIGLSYLRSALFPIRNEKNLEEFLVNRFGRRLYRLFFKSYTEKVWGMPCHEISPDWGAQRIKGLSVRAALAHFLSSRQRGRSTGDQKDVETTLIESFWYPKYGPGQFWETVASEIVRLGGEIILHMSVERIFRGKRAISALEARDTRDGSRRRFATDCVFSTMPIRNFVAALDPAAPADVVEISEGLVYRDFLTVGLLLKRLNVSEPTGTEGLIPDNWIYVQEPDVRMGRIQIFNNWSKCMLADPSNVWIGVEYFFSQGDEIAGLSDDRMVALAISELERIGFVRPDDVLDSTVLREEKAYPAYVGAYDRFHVLREFLDGIENLYCIGRNGMHRYNNMDHSMLSAMTAVDQITKGIRDREPIWRVNSE